MSPARGAWFGWMGGSFLIGISLHSIWPYQAISAVVISIVIALACILLCWPRTHSAHAWKAGLMLLAVCLGVWRFEMVRPQLPYRLKPFTPNRMAFVAMPKAPAHQKSIQHWLWLQRQRLRQRTEKIFPTDEGALLRGILYGERELSKTWNERFRRAGLLHIIAVSGSNITIVVVMTMSALLALGCSRRQAFVILSAILVLFVLFVSPSASVVRAAIMGWLLGLAPLVGRLPRPSRLLLLAALLFVFWKPWALFYDAGFALSFLAMWGLLTWSTYFQIRLERFIPSAFFREVVAATLGASLMTMPYLAWAFGQFSLGGVIGSMIVVPFIPWIMGTGALAMLFPFFTPIVLAAQGFLQGVLWVAGLTDRLPSYLWPEVSFPFWAMLIAYYILAMAWSYAQSSISRYPHPTQPKR